MGSDRLEKLLSRLERVGLDKSDQLEHKDNALVDVESQEPQRDADNEGDDHQWEEFSDDGLSLADLEKYERISIHREASKKPAPMHNSIKDDTPWWRRETAYKAMARIASLIGLWYLLSACMSLVSIPGQGKTQSVLNYPLLTVAVSQVVTCWLAAGILLIQKLRQGSSKAEYHALPSDASENGGKCKRIRFSRLSGVEVSTNDEPHSQESETSSLATWQRMFPLGACIAMEICLSTYAVQKLSDSLGTMAFAPLGVLIFGLILGVEQFSKDILASILVMCSAMAMAMFGQSNLDASGILIQSLSTCVAGLRWAFLQKEMHNKDQSKELLTPMTIIFYTTPWVALVLFPIAYSFELPSVHGHVWSASDFVILFVIGSIVLVLQWSQYELVRLTSALAVSVAAVLKQLLFLVGGSLLFTQPITSVNWIGSFICQSGIIYFVFLRY